MVFLKNIYLLFVIDSIDTEEEEEKCLCVCLLVILSSTWCVLYVVLLFSLVLFCSVVSQSRTLNCNLQSKQTKQTKEKEQLEVAMIPTPQNVSDYKTDKTKSSLSLT
jgi:hypothetical protein